MNLGIGKGRLLLVTAIAGSSAAVLAVLLEWAIDQIMRHTFWRAGLVFLTVFEWAYLLAVALSLAAMPILLGLAIRRRPGAARSVARRTLLAIGSLAIGLALAEATAWAWLSPTRRAGLLPAARAGYGLRVSRERLWPPITSDPVALTESFPDPPGEGEIDLVMLGESSAAGVPFDEWLSIGHLLAWKIEAAIPGRPVRLHILAFSGDTLELQHQRLVQLLRRPELLVIYVGHNEFGSRLHGDREVDHYRDGRVPPAWRRLLIRAEAVSPLCELNHLASERCRLELPPEGHRELVDVPAFTPEEARLILADYRRRLEAILDYAERLGTLVAMVVPPGNDAGFEPNRSYLPAETLRPERDAFAREFLAARRLEASDPFGAIAAYRRLIDRQPGFAESHYRLGVLLDRAGDVEAAYREFIAARDADGFPVRCKTPFQEVVRELAARHRTMLVDGQAEFHAIGPRGRLDDHLFQDAMHPSFRGLIALTQAILRTLREHRAFGWPEGAPAPIIDPSEAAARYGMGPGAWKKICLWGVHFGNYAIPLRYDPASRLQRRLRYADAYDRMVAGASIESLGLPNLGIPEPVPAMDDAVPKSTPRSPPP